MLQNHKLAKHISDCSWYELVRQLKYKANWYGREIVEIGRFYPSSKTHYECGWINKDLKLSDRIWTCVNCNTLVDRDLNAAKNIEKEGLRIWSGLGVKSDIKQKEGEASRCKESLRTFISIML